LNPAATDLIYGTYIGGNLEDKIYSPYVNKFGDLWVCGQAEDERWYDLFDATGKLSSEHKTIAGLDSGFITTLAFKASLDLETAGSPEQQNVSYGITDMRFPANPGPWYPYTYSDPEMRLEDPPFAGWSMESWNDAYVLKYRLGLPVISNFTLDPAAIAGGDPTGGSNPPSTTATVTMNQAAPAGGINVVFSIANSTMASFSPTSTVSQVTLTIPAGSTSVSTTVYSRKVTTRSTVDIKAEYEGNFQIRSLVVEPWLQKLSFTPNDIAGGNTVSGRITLYAPAPAAVKVTVSSESGADPIDQPGIIMIPAGQDFGTFTLQTHGVDIRQTVKLTATLLGVAISETVVVEPATVKSVELTPQNVADGTKVNGIVHLDGEAGPTTIKVNLAVTNDNLGTYVITPQSVKIAQGLSSAAFVVKVPIETATSPVERIVRATRQGNANDYAEGSFIVTPISLKSVVLNQATNEIEGGFTAEGVVTISDPAPAGGLPVYLFTNLPSGDTTVAVPVKVTVEAGATSASFTVTTKPVLAKRIVEIEASRSSTLSGPYQKMSVTVLPQKITDLSVDQNPASGGDSVNGTVTLDSPAPAGGLVIHLKVTKADGTATTVASTPDSVTVKAGNTSAPFTVTTKVIAGTANLTIWASRDGSFPTGVPITKTLAFKVENGLRVLSISFNPSTVQGGNSTVMTVTLNGSNPGTTPISIKLSASDSTLLNLPATISVQPGTPAGPGYKITKTITSNQVARNLQTTVTASLGTSSATTTVTVTR